MVTTIHGCLLFLVVVVANFYGVHSTSVQQLSGLEIRHYNGTTLSEYEAATVGEAEKLVSNLDPNLPTVLYFGGWMENLEVGTIPDITAAYLEIQTYNVLVGDWSEITALGYVLAATSTYDVGVQFAEALIRMIAAGFNMDTLHIVGHSLGAQTAGCVGRYLNGTVPRITGLDPAGPFFNILETSLSAGDAKFVDLIHTDMGAYGSPKLIGDVDFLPNNGLRIQPGCPLFPMLFSMIDSCSHQRSCSYWAESVLNNNAFVGVSCDSTFSFEGHLCDSNEKVLMGVATPNTAKGTYYLQTNSASPFGCGTYTITV